MEDTALNRFRTALRRLRILLENWADETRRDMKREPFPQYGISACVLAEPYDEEESQDLFIPPYSVVKIQGDGYDCVFENTSSYDKSAYLVIKHRANQVQWSNPPPLFEEGDKHE